MVTFWDAFWPNVASTVLGVILGLPAALWLNRQAVAHGERIRIASERAKVAQALSVVAQAMKHNAEQLTNLVTILSGDKAQFDLPLDTGSVLSLVEK